ncbi:MAG: helicase-exonuclease AddAB subunit AddA [Clostridia bacterium]|nr:helicase-exonuclease AddAB subunit AddA [Clostridia bacterium]
MSNVKWTPEQESAIEARGGTLLVSAAAGSGKTAVLSERVIRMLTDPVHPVDADRLLIVTFTKAAAAEMKQRIGDKLSALLEKNPGDRRLLRQRLLLDQAHISTVHSFCSDLMRNHFHRLGLSPTFRVATEDEMLTLSGRVMDEVSEDMYRQFRIDPEPGMAELVDLFSDDRGDRRLGETVRRLYEYIRSHPFPARWLRERAALYEQDAPLRDTPWGEVLFRYARETAEYCVMLAEGAMSTARQDEAVAKAYMPALIADLTFLAKVHQAAEQGEWDTLTHLLQTYNAMRLGSPKKADPAIKEKAQNMRSDVKDQIEELTKIFDQPEEAARAELRKQYPVIRALNRLVTEYSDRLDALKKEKNIVDFGDLEHGALQLLVEETDDGMRPTALAEELRADYDEVMVDEYQDTNYTQDMIFRAISRNEENLFLVGDVKQSIYRFRQASPELFIRRRQDYTLYSPGYPKFPATVLLGRNFRSRAGVTSICNFLFRQLMSEHVGEVTYDHSEELVPQAAYDPTDRPEVTFAVLDASGDAEVHPEARWIAGEIRNAMEAGVLVKDGSDYRPVQYRDFCVLLRSAAGHAEAYLDEFRRSGIPCSGDVQNGFFGQREIMFLLALLRIIDNPAQDVPLLAVMCAPLYGFTPDELAQVRLAAPKRPLYEAVKAAAEENEKLRVFLEELAHWRRCAASGDTRALIQRIFTEKRLESLTLAMPDGEVRLANLRLLAEYAGTYEKAGYRGLSGFIRYIDRLQEQQGDFNGAAPAEQANVVRVMTIHRSKGLEFPYVFVADCGRQFNRQNLMGDLLLHPELGAALRRRDPVTGAKYHTVAYDAVRQEVERNELSEQMRVLYVALTRAREHLYMTCTLKDPEKEIAGLAAQLRTGAQVPASAVRKADSFAEWLILGLLRHPDSGLLRTMSGAAELEILTEPGRLNVVRQQSAPPEIVAEEAGALPEADACLLQQLQQRLAPLPSDGLSRVPVKAGISALAEAAQETAFATTARPAFLSQAGMTPAERGTAMHTFLQFADYHAAAEDPRRELERLAERGFLTQEQAAVVSLKQAAALFRSDLGQRILQSERVHREVRFFLEYPAWEYDPSVTDRSAMVVLQGVADCVLEADDGLTLIDFKTDRVQSEEELIRRYGQQLRLYRRALLDCFGKPVTETVIYSTVLARAIAVE